VAVHLPGGTFFASKELILGRITAILASYRKYCATSSSAVRAVCGCRAGWLMNLWRAGGGTQQLCSVAPSAPRAAHSATP
jgi:hypothetical protein